MRSIVSVCCMLALSTLGVTAFRPPAIPLLTTDPFMQTWMRGDTSTSASVTHWDGKEKQMVGLIRVDGATFQFLGTCTPAAVSKPGPATAHLGHDISPSRCDIANFGGIDESLCNQKCYSNPDCVAYVMSAADHKCYLKSCAAPVAAATGKDGYVITGQHPTCESATVTQQAVTVHPTRTVFEFEYVRNEAQVALNVTFLSSMFTDDFVRLSRPVYWIDVAVQSLDGKPHSVQLYLDASAQHAVNDYTQQVSWSSTPWQQDMLKGVQIGNAVQKVLGSKGDRVNIDWGSLHLATAHSNGAVWAGSAAVARASFTAHGALPSQADSRMPRAVSDDLPGVSATIDLGSIHSSSQSFMMAYDDVKSVNYFGKLYAGYWTRTYGTIQNATTAAYAEHDAMLAKSESHDAALTSKLSKFGVEYATLCALSYRQTLAATKLVWNEDKQTVWNFLKEISTNGDMQTMDVIYPASPMLLYTNPELLKLLLIPVLAYANNETYIRFSNPYSPHQLGTYPIADAPTSAQEPMPLENSGNMLFMLLGIVRQQPKSDTSWLYPTYFPMLSTWADELVRTTEFPADQICTDDFTGRLANNTNLGAKGIIGLEAFAELCRLVDNGRTTNCTYYSDVARDYAATWQQYAFTTDNGQAHYKMSYNTLKGIDDSWSIKYNILWQKILKLNGPFPWETVVPTELAYYKTKANKYGIPMDPRHTYVKTDWLSWIAAMEATDEAFKATFNPIFHELNDTPDRNPFTDLYDTTDAHQSSGGFIARPVIGGLFAKALLDA